MVKTAKTQRTYKDTNSKFFLIMCIVMVISISAMGVLLTARSVSNMKTMAWNYMESVATSAATLIDGDELKQITEEDTPTLDKETGARIADGSERCTKIEQILIKIRDSQKDFFIPYIYITRLENGKQVFVIDPDIDSPGEYGEEVVFTPSQPIAWAGSSRVDEEPYADEWGTYYTAWSPIKDSHGRVVGLVGVDFEATQITNEIKNSMIIIIGSTLILLALSILFFVLYSNRMKKRMQVLGNEINGLSDNLKTMFDEIEGIDNSRASNAQEKPQERDLVNYVHDKTITMTQRLRAHTAYMEQLANIDYLTKVGNTRAYSKEKEQFQEDINNGKADFAIVLCDINELKKCNDNYGHECGDRLITSTAEVLKKTFMSSNIYRIGGDEFAVIIPEASERTINLKFELMDIEIEKVNDYGGMPTPLAIAKGFAIFDASMDKKFKDVFVRADQNMYSNKNEYHEKHDTIE